MHGPWADALDGGAQIDVTVSGDGKYLILAADNTRHGLVLRLGLDEARSFAYAVEAHAREVERAHRADREGGGTP